MGPARCHRRRAGGDSDCSVNGEFDAAAKHVVQSWPPLSPEGRAELGRILATADVRPPATTAGRPGEDVRAGSSPGSTDAEVKEWARREAAKAPPFRPGQRDLIISVLQTRFRATPTRTTNPEARPARNNRRDNNRRCRNVTNVAAPSSRPKPCRRLSIRRQGIFGRNGIFFKNFCGFPTRAKSTT